MSYKAEIMIPSFSGEEGMYMQKALERGEIAAKGEMTKAVLLNPDGSETNLNCYKEKDRLFVDIPTLSPWDIAFVLLK